jgi:ubiquinone/menaquinone biosynthesis C-methylase UbiE
MLGHQRVERGMGDDSTKPLHKAYKSKSAEETSGVYDGWAAEYEDHMVNVGYTHPAMVAAMLSRHVTPSGDPVLDAGTGTGVLGEVLTALGFTDLTGLDASEGMLARAAEKGKYKALSHAFLGEPLDFADNAFAAVVSSGVFTQGHAPLTGFDELIRVTRPGGFLVFSVSRTYLDGPFEEKRAQLENDGLWRAVDATERYNSTPQIDEVLMSQEDVTAAAIFVIGESSARSHLWAMPRRR